MKNIINRKRQEGFTIIEVLIVLAIAGLIILIVFLAVPALQRNSRNTQYKNDAANILSAANEFISNNNGKTPVAADNAAIMSNAKTQSITTLNVSTGTTSQISFTSNQFGQARIVTGVKCGAGVGGTTGITPTTASTRSFIVIYAVENSAGNAVYQCTES